MEFFERNSNNTYDNYQRVAQPINATDSKTARLMELISLAIENWAREYHLENMPKKIIFEQALDAMRVIEFAMNNKGL